MSDDAGDVEAVVRAYWADYQALRFSVLPAYWDRTEPEPMLFPEEEDRPLSDRVSIDRYLGGLGQLFLAVHVSISEFECRFPAPQLASVVFRMRWDGLFHNREQPIAGLTHHLGVLTRRSGSWKFIQYVEAPRSPTLYLRRLREGIVDPSIAAGLRRSAVARGT